MQSVLRAEPRPPWGLPHRLHQFRIHHSPVTPERAEEIAKTSDSNGMCRRTPRLLLSKCLVDHAPRLLLSKCLVDHGHFGLAAHDSNGMCRQTPRLLLRKCLVDHAPRLLLSKCLVDHGHFGLAARAQFVNQASVSFRTARRLPWMPVLE